MRLNNIKALINRFLHHYAIKNNDEEAEELYDGEFHMIVYEDDTYYIPKELSLDESDELLEEMIMNTFTP